MQLREICKTLQLRRKCRIKLVLREVENSDFGQLANLGRYGPTQLVIVKVQPRANMRNAK